MQEQQERADAARAVERLRLAEARLARRRQTDCGPSETARAAMRFVQEESDAGRKVTPTLIAQHIGIATASVTPILNRLRDGGLLTFRRNPDDARSKHVVPVDRDDDIDDIDPLTTRIRSLVDELSDDDAAVVAAFLERVTASVDRECR